MDPFFRRRPADHNPIPPIKVPSATMIGRVSAGERQSWIVRHLRTDLTQTKLAAGSGSYGEVLAYSTNGKKSLTPIMIEAPSPKDIDGYMGHDAYEVMENTFVRRFPVYRKGDTNSSPSGGFRQFQYKLKPGEAAWQMKIDRVESY
jgi:hypothetical protein